MKQITISKKIAELTVEMYANANYSKSELLKMAGHIEYEVSKYVDDMHQDNRIVIEDHIIKYIKSRRYD